MKILLINKFHYKKGGSETYYFSLAEALIKKGHEVVFFSMEDSKNELSKEKAYFVSNINYNDKKNLFDNIKYAFKSIYSFEAKKKMEELIIKEKPDIAHIGLLHRQLTFSIVNVLKKHNIPIVMTMHDLIFTCPNYKMLSNNNICTKCIEGNFKNCVSQKCIKNSTMKSLLAFIEAIFLKKKRYYNKIDLYIAECDMYKKLMEQSKFTNSHIIKMHNFLPVSQKYEFNPEYENYILYFGRLSNEKGVITLLDALKITGCKHKCIIIGNGPQENEIKEYIAKNKISNIEMLGPIYGEKLKTILEHSKAVIVPSEWYENCPYTVLESMARGKIIIASKIGGLPELISDKKTGFLFEMGNSQDLSQKIDYVMNMKTSDYLKMSNNILEYAKKKFDWERYTDKLLKQYNILLKKKED